MARPAEGALAWRIALAHLASTANDSRPAELEVLAQTEDTS
jgi:hypothetical protein